MVKEIIGKGGGTRHSIKLEPLVEVKGLTKHFPIMRGILISKQVGAVQAVDNSATGAIYKGLAMGFNESGAFLFATNFHAGTVDVFDSSFKPVRTPGMFSASSVSMALMMPCA